MSLTIEVKCSGQSDAPHREVVAALFEGIKQTLANAGLAYTPSFSIYEMTHTEQRLPLSKDAEAEQPFTYSTFHLYTAIHKNSDSAPALEKAAESHTDSFAGYVNDGPTCAPDSDEDMAGWESSKGLEKAVDEGTDSDE